MSFNTQTQSSVELPFKSLAPSGEQLTASSAPGFKLKWYQEPHYKNILYLLKKYRCALDASDTGTGKTYVALAVCRALGVTPLVVGTKSARGGWLAAGKLAGVEIEYVNYEKLRGRRTADSPTAVSEWVEEKPWGKGSFLKWKNPVYMVIFDEVHRCSGSTSLNSKTLIAAKRQHHLVLCLSATAADDPRQMKALGYAIDQHTLSKKVPGRKNWMAWLLGHGCTPGVFSGFDLSTKSDKLKTAFTKLHHEIFVLPQSVRGARMRKSEIPGFPETVIDTLLLSPEDGKAMALAEELHALSDKPSDLAERMLVRQKLELLKVPYFADATADYLTTSKVVVFVNFTETITALRTALSHKYNVGIVWGMNTPEERAKTLADFQANRLDVLLVNSQAGGESANMHDPTGQIERTALISPMDSARQLKQVFGRVHRDGGAKSQQFIVAFKDTYEETMVAKLKQKNFNLDMLNDGDLKI